MNLVFATHNAHKLEEVQKLLPAEVHLQSLAALGHTTAIEETGATLSANAWIKADAIFSQYHTDCFADDTGLEVKALRGAPGVYSARYAGPQANAQANLQKLLRAMEGQSNREAQFRTVIALHFNGDRYTFEGVVKGQILEQPTGDGGFGYDPVFQPVGYRQSFAQLTLEEKNKISHRGLAMQKLAVFLLSQIR